MNSFAFTKQHLYLLNVSVIAMYKNRHYSCTKKNGKWVYLKLLFNRRPRAVTEKLLFYPHNLLSLQGAILLNNKN